MKDPHIGVFVREMQSHAVSVMGAVRKPGTFQISGSKTLLEILSLAEGLADDAGEDVTILRGAAQNKRPRLFLKTRTTCQVLRLRCGCRSQKDGCSGREQGQNRRSFPRTWCK